MLYAFLAIILTAIFQVCIHANPRCTPEQTDCTLYTAKEINCVCFFLLNPLYVIFSSCNPLRKRNIRTVEQTCDHARNQSWLDCKPDPPMDCKPDPRLRVDRIKGTCFPRHQCSNLASAQSGVNNRCNQIHGRNDNMVSEIACPHGCTTSLVLCIDAK